MSIKTYKILPKEAINIRTSVFTIEQGFSEEFDDIDDISTHLVKFQEDEPIGTCRFYYDKSLNSYAIGRIAVVKDCRGLGFGTELLKEAEQQIKNLNQTSVRLCAQLHLKEFYESHGYIAFGEIIYDEHCPHINMQKKFS